MAAHALRIEIADAMGGLGTFGPVCLHVAKETPTLERMREVMRLQARLRSARGGVIGSLSVVEASAVSPQSKQEREATTELMLGSPVRASAIVIEGSGFRAAAARTVIAGFFLLSKPYPVKVIASGPDGAAWLVEMLVKEGVRDLTAASLAAALVQLREALPRAPA